MSFIDILIVLDVVGIVGILGYAVWFWWGNDDEGS